MNINSGGKPNGVPERPVRPRQAYATLRSRRSRCSRRGSPIGYVLRSKPARIWRFVAFSFFQDLDHGGGSNNSGGFVLFQGEEFLIAGHKELGLAGFSQRGPVTFLGVRGGGAGGGVRGQKREG